MVGLWWCWFIGSMIFFFFFGGGFTGGGGVWGNGGGVALLGFSFFVGGCWAFLFFF